MAGETRKTEGIALAIRPWSRTSHVVTWLTPDAGPVATVVKGAVRPKSAFLGQYDLFYTCDLVYYANSRGELHPLREASPVERRDGLRGRWRETTLAGYAAELARQLAPAGEDAAAWYSFLGAFLDKLATGTANLAESLVRLEAGTLSMAGLKPDFTGADMSEPWSYFSIERGRAGDGPRAVRLSSDAMRYLESQKGGVDYVVVDDAIRFLGLFIAFHLDLPPETRRLAVQAARVGGVDLQTGK